MATDHHILLDASFNDGCWPCGWVSRQKSEAGKKNASSRWSTYGTVGNQEEY